MKMSGNLPPSDSEQMDLLGGMEPSGLTLSPLGSRNRARTSQSPGKAQELKASGQDYSMKSLGLLATLEKPDSHPSTWYWRTSQLSLLEDWERFLSGWSRSGTMQNGTVFQLPQLTDARTEGTDGGVWPTPTTMDSLPPKSPEALHREATVARPGRSRPANLRDCVQPESMTMWPTPTANEDAAGTTEGSLNPTWVCWLMGYPLDWLDLDGWQNPELEGLPPEYLTEPPD